MSDGDKSELKNQEMMDEAGKLFLEFLKNWLPKKLNEATKLAARMKTPQTPPAWVTFHTRGGETMCVRLGNIIWYRTALERAGETGEIHIGGGGTVWVRETCEEIEEIVGRAEDIQLCLDKVENR